jgi:hypothetical protein
MTAPAVTSPKPVRTQSTVCWYADPARRPSLGRCPATCNGAPTHAERRADGSQRLYCEAHAYWRASEVGRHHLRALRPGEIS